MFSSRLFCLLVGASSLGLAYDPQLGFNTRIEVETRSLEQIYQAALKEGGTITVWHGGDESNQQNNLKSDFEARFPGMAMNITVDLSKYHDGNIDRQLATGDVYVDSVILQTVHDYPRWKQEDALLYYQPLGFEKIYNDFRDKDGAYTGMYAIGWAIIWNTIYISNADAPKEYPDFLKPEFKDKLVLTYPNDDDSVLFQFNLILQQYGYSWFEALLAQNPRWVRGTGAPVDLILSSNGTYTATFTSFIGLTPFAPLGIAHPVQGEFVSWPQTGAILKDAPHPEAAKLLHSWILSNDYQNVTGAWSVRRDLPAPAGYEKIMDQVGTDPTKFGQFMADRAAVERLRFFFEDRIGTPQGLSPLIDGL